MTFGNDRQMTLQASQNLLPVDKIQAIISPYLIMVL